MYEKTISGITIFYFVFNYCEPLQQIMTEKQFTQAAFISAFNPYSEIFDASENLKRHNALSKELNDLGFDFLQGIGRDKEGQWPGEKCFGVKYTE